MKKVFTIATALVLSFQLSYGQGVKQFWATYASIDGGDHLQIWSVDTTGNSPTKRFDVGKYWAPSSGGMTSFSGKIYGTEATRQLLYSYDPMTDEFLVEVPIVPEHNGSGTFPFVDITKSGDKLYGVAKLFCLDCEEGQNLGDYLFEWDSTTHAITKENHLAEHPIGKLTEKDGKFYGITFSKIFEWDPGENTVTYKVNFGFNTRGVYSNDSRELLLYNGKFYGFTGNDDQYDEEPPPAPTIFEWDPETDGLVILHEFNDEAAGNFPLGNLIEKDGKLYGKAEGGIDGKGIIFEYDLTDGGTGYTKKQDLDDYDISLDGVRYNWVLLNDYFYGLATTVIEGQMHYVLYQWNPETNSFSVQPQYNLGMFLNLLAVPAPVSMFIPGSCTTFTPVSVDASNNNRWIPVTDDKGDVLAEIQPNENNLGTINVEAYIHDGAIRKDGQGHPYLDRNITITPQNTTIADPVELRLYITKAEIETLKADPASGITDISDLAIFKSADACSGALITSALPIPTTYEDYEFGYVLKASVSSFSTFYFSNRIFEALPLQFIDFTAIQKGSDALLQWITENEINTRDFAVEKSMDGVHFISIGNVAAKNITGKQSYSFTDKNIDQLNTGTVYYRLKQNDIDGNTDYSKTVSIRLSNAASLKLSPNPAGSVLNLTYKKTTGNNAIVQIIDAGGKKVLEQRLSAQTANHKININALAKGVYLISVIDNGERLITRFVKQ